MLNRTRISSARICAATALALGLCFGLAPTGMADTFRLGVQEAEEFKQAEIVSAPEPVITPELKEECLNAFCVARFNIDVKGRIRVELVTSSGCPEVDDITISTLRGWRFRPALRGTEPVTSTRKVRVEFLVE